jgi:TRAP-type C4-dicarboxylate transport system permease small subunit
MKIRRIAQISEGWIYKLSKIMGIIAIIILVVMMLFTVLDIFLRALFNSPIPGDVEIIEISMVSIGFFGLAWCAMRGMHIKVDLIVSFLPERVQRIIDSFNYILGFGLCFIFAWRGILEGLVNLEMKALTNILKWPLFPLLWIVAFGYAVLCLAILVLLVRTIKGETKQ